MELQIVRLLVFAGPATDEILELQFVKLMVFAGRTTEKIGTPDYKECGLCWPATEKNWKA